MSRSALQFLFAEMVSYTQSRVSGIADFERRLGELGRHVGLRVLALQTHRTQLPANAKRPQRETRLLKALLWLHSAFWKSVFGHAADSLERSTESDRADECTWRRSRRHDLDERAAAVYGPVCAERNDAAECRGAGRRHRRRRPGGPRIRTSRASPQPARVTAHSVPTDAFPFRTTILIKLDRSVMEREAALGGP